MGWSNRQFPGRRAFSPYVMCHQEHCNEQVGRFNAHTCEQCYRYFCPGHLYRVSVETTTLKLCKKCALERDPAIAIEETKE